MKFLKIKKSYVILLLIVLVFFAFVFTIGHPIILRSYISMYPTVEATDVLFLNKIAYLSTTPKRGDITLSIDNSGVSRDMPSDSFTKLIHPIYWSKKHRIIVLAPIGFIKPTNLKRVIGLPGDSLEIINKQVFINGEVYFHGAEIFIDESSFPLDWDF